MLAENECRPGPDASFPLVFGSVQVAQGQAGRANPGDDPSAGMSARGQQQQRATDMCQMVAQPTQLLVPVWAIFVRTSVVLLLCFGLSSCGCFNGRRN